jgi:shikimate dehydrogenase
MKIDQHTQLYGIIGSPLGHTLSPVMHNAAFRACGLNAVYLAFETMDLKGAIQGLKALGMRGLSITIPHKINVLSMLDEVDGLARKIGAVNTIVGHQGKLIGSNTDALGALRALEERIKLDGKRGLLIGAGGAARAIGFILRDAGVALTLTNRTPERGEALAASLSCPFIPLDKIRKVEADLLIQTTSVGMHPQEDRCLAPPDLLRKGMVVMDVVYNPVETGLIRMARNQGCVTINGLSMFIHQGAEQFRLWTGLTPPLEEMTRAVQEALAR